MKNKRAMVALYRKIKAYFEPKKNENDKYRGVWRVKNGTWFNLVQVYVPPFELYNENIILIRSNFPLTFYKIENELIYFDLGWCIVSYKVELWELLEKEKIK